MSLLRQLGGQTIVYGLGQILPKIFHFFVFSSYLSYRLETKAEYSIYLELYAFVSVLLVICSYRMDTALFRFGRKTEDLEHTYQTALLPMLITSAFIGFLGIYFSDQLAVLIDHPGKGYYVRWFSLIISFDVLALLPMARLRLQNKAKTFVLFKVANVIITVGFLLFFLEIIPRFFPDIRSQYLAFAKSDVDFVFISNLIASALMFGALIIYQVPKSIKIDWTLWKKMVTYSWPLIIVGVAGSINQFFGVPLQIRLLSEADIDSQDQAAIYGAVQKLPGLLAMFITAYNYAAEPFFFKNVDNHNAKQLYGDIAHFFIVLAGGLGLFVYLGIDALGFLIDPQYHEGFYLVPVLVLAYLFLGIYYNVSVWYKLSDKTTYGAAIAAAGAIITIGGSVLLLPYLGIIASAWVALLCYVTMVILAYVFGQRHYPIDYPIVKMVRQVILIAAILFIGYLMRSDSRAMNLGLGAILISGYAFISWRLDGDRLRLYL